MIISKKKLLPMLVEQGFIESEKKVSYEAFGRKVFAFVQTASFADRQRMQNFLRSKGIRYEADYWPGSAVASVPVSYFKAWHWDE